MKTVGTRDLKQNPQRVIRRVLESGDSLEITSYGKPSGVRLVPDRAAPSSWVSGADLADLAPIQPEDAAAWRADIDVTEDDGPGDPWQ
ncbi:type II toxin-antitoxin system Phd/YefM family antitoxin [Georgenia deserti]|uniref:Type II toxin-antitoxin system Phd/YefM family antitoxin n=1 Tax=Georgenia deserti TaxID=2093781 RepID=A0ABW4L1H6_9MICO